ncbi:hypothetical protein [Streptacidiphilus cavernicola]|uniref:Uncharacterized protein n=1 Tax=Streptacidiphilus cavernicola TaxID=3342716 RepID=A0ABV6VY71_9ACTN
MSHLPYRCALCAAPPSWHPMDLRHRYCSICGSWPWIQRMCSAVADEHVCDLLFPHGGLHLCLRPVEELTLPTRGAGGQCSRVAVFSAVCVSFADRPTALTADSGG